MNRAEPAIAQSSTRLKLTVSLGAVFLFATTVPCAPANAQDVKIDWASRKVVSSPQEIQKGNPLIVEVSNVNDVLYAYSVDVQLTTDNSDDFSLLASLLNLGGAGGTQKAALVSDCNSNYQDALFQAKTIKDLLAAAGGPFNPEDRPGHFISIPLITTLQGWNGPIAAASKALQADVDALSGCTGDDYTTFVGKTYPPIKTSLESIQKKIDGKHTASGQASASTGDVVSARITVSEKWKGNETLKDQNSSTASPFVSTLNFSSVLRLSAGFLFSQLQDRSYVTRTVPTSTGTANVLGVNGDSALTPYLVGLLNYQVPHLSGKYGGLWLSSGPTLRITTTGGNTSAFGFFGGVSASLWNRLFITPGIHFGQFAATPAGLTVGQTIPANFGQVQPINRWSARFGFSITYKTLSLGSLTKSSTKTSTDQTPAPGTTTKPPSNGNAKPTS
jgi:hypothetical protein